MKPEYKIEGDVLKFKVDHSVGLDSDNDGAQAVKASVAIIIEADGSEILEELLKSDNLISKAVAFLKEKGLL